MQLKIGTGVRNTIPNEMSKVPTDPFLPKNFIPVQLPKITSFGIFLLNGKY